MTTLKKVVGLLSVITVGLSSVTPALAALPTVAPVQLNVNTQKAGFSITNVSSLITGLLNMVMFVAALLVFAYLIWGGLQWITSGGDKGKTEEARNKITAAIIGLAVVAASYAIFLLVISFLGVGNPFSEGFSITPAYNNNGGTTRCDANGNCITQ